VPTAQLNQDIITGGIQCAIVDIDVVGRRHRHNSIAAPSVDGHMTDVGLLSPELRPVDVIALNILTAPMIMAGCVD